MIANMLRRPSIFSQRSTAARLKSTRSEAGTCRVIRLPMSTLTPICSGNNIDISHMIRRNPANAHTMENAPATRASKTAQGTCTHDSLTKLSTIPNEVKRKNIPARRIAFVLLGTVFQYLADCSHPEVLGIVIPEEHKCIATLRAWVISCASGLHCADEQRV